MNPIPLSAPYAGQNDLIPLVELKNPYCAQVTNFNLDDGNLILRNGDSYRGDATSSTITYLQSYGVGTGEMLLGLRDTGADTAIYNYTTPGAGVSIYNVVGATNDRNIQTTYFNGYQVFYGEATLKPSSLGNPQYNGTIGSISGYTYSTITPFGGNSYNNRIYLIGYESTKYGYGGINAISGAITEVDLAQIISQKGFLYCICNVSLSEGIEQQLVQCFIFNTGEVLAYKGSYPNGSDWSLVGRFFIPPPVQYNKIVEANGDVFVVTKSSLVSLRTLFTQGVDVAVQQGISAPIRKRWKQIFNDSGLTHIETKALFDQSKQRITIILKSYVSRDTGSPEVISGMRLIYSFKTKSWTEHKIPLLGPGSFGVYLSAAYFGGQILQASANSSLTGITISEGASDFLDAQVSNNSLKSSYTFEVISAPVADGRSYVQRATGMDLILESDLYETTNYQWIRDLGVATSDFQKIPFDQSSLIKTHLNLGMKGSYIQYKISGSTSVSKTVGYKLYGLNYWQDPGSVPR